MNDIISAITEYKDKTNNEEVKMFLETLLSKLNGKNEIVHRLVGYFVTKAYRGNSVAYTDVYVAYISIEGLCLPGLWKHATYQTGILTGSFITNGVD